MFVPGSADSIGKHLLLAQELEAAGNDSSRGWLQLAADEIAAKNVESALGHIRQALSVVKPNFSVYKEVDGLFGDYCGAINTLLSAEREAEAENAYTQMLNKCRSIYGSDSLEYECDLGHSILFCIQANKLTLAEKYLNELLALDPRRIESGRYGTVSGRRLLLAAKMPGGDKNAFCLKMLERLVHAQEKIYGKDDMRVGETLIALAELQIDRGEFSSAEENLKRAYDISLLYDLQLYGSPSPAQMLLKLYEKEGQTRQKEVAALKEQMNARSRSKVQNRIEANGGDIEHLIWWQTNVPFSQVLIDFNFSFLLEAKKAANYKDVEKLSASLLKIFEHYSFRQPFAGVGFSILSVSRFQCYLDLAQAYIKLDKKDKAKELLTQVEALQSYHPLPDELVFLSQMAQLCGDKVRSLKYCRAAELGLAHDFSYSCFRPMICNQYNSLGESFDAERMRLEDQLSSIREKTRPYDNSREPRLDNPVALSAVSQNQMRSGVPPSIRDQIQAEKNWKIAPEKPLVFAASQPLKDRFCFNYVVQASKSIVLGKNSYVKRIMSTCTAPPTSWLSYAGTGGELIATQPVHSEPEFKFLYDGIMPLVGPQDPSVRMPIMSGPVPGALPISCAPSRMSEPFKPAPPVPVSAHKLIVADSNRDVFLRPGDYVADNLDVDAILVPQTELVRIFLVGSPSKPALKVAYGGIVNAIPEDKLVYHSYRLEIWYDGKGTIEFGKNTRFVGLLYAPNAAVRIGDGSSFRGAAVVSSLEAGDNVTLTFDPYFSVWGARNLKEHGL